ncbi:MAG TPA: hypothetical protein VK135_04500 [Candidatus Dormibacteraeota bacterium]|nr:hypothetical protein [Candidatus Dormibacteraeota bacterium]
MKYENDDEQLMKKLRQLPKIEDHGNKDELFQRISTQMVERKQQKSYRLAPILSTLIIAICIIAVIPVFIDLGRNANTLNDTAGNMASESAENHHVEMYSTDKHMDEAEISSHDSDVESYVLQDVDYMTVVYGAVGDDQLQTVIPVTILTSGVNDLNAQYNHLDKYLETSDWGLNDYLLKHANFEIDLDKAQVLVSFSDHFSIGEGSAYPRMFEKILAKMFMPYEIEKVVFDEEIDLGAIGKVTELSLHDNGKENYKIFQADEHHRKFLVPLEMDDQVTIEEAILDMKKGDPAYHIQSTIPADVDFSFTKAEEELIITLTNDWVFENEQKATTMIEAILMTAKSFGFKRVRFNEMSVDQIGPYQFSESITVPEAINPIFP